MRWLSKAHGIYTTSIIFMHIDMRLFSNGRGLLTSKEQIPPASYGPAASAFPKGLRTQVPYITKVGLIYWFLVSALGFEGFGLFP